MLARWCQRSDRQSDTATRDFCGAPLFHLPSVTTDASFRRFSRRVATGRGSSSTPTLANAIQRTFKHDSLGLLWSTTNDFLGRAKTAHLRSSPGFAPLLLALPTLACPPGLRTRPIARLPGLQARPIAHPSGPLTRPALCGLCLETPFVPRQPGQAQQSVLRQLGRATSVRCTKGGPTPAIANRDFICVSYAAIWYGDAQLFHRLGNPHHRWQSHAYLTLNFYSYYLCFQ